MTNDNDLLLLASSQNNKIYGVYIDSSGRKTLTPQTANYAAKHEKPYVCYHSGSTIQGLLANKNPKKVIFPNCSEVKGENTDPFAGGAFFYAFQNCTSLTSVSFPVLTRVSGEIDNDTYYTYGAFEGAFYGCSSLTSVSFPSLTTATGSSEGELTNTGAFLRAFKHCTSLTSVVFPSLTTATGGEGSGSSYKSGAFQEAFYGCSSLTSVSFPSLTTIKSTADNTATFYDAFNACPSSLRVHFKKSMKGKTGLDYKTMSLKNADQVVFDLP